MKNLYMKSLLSKKYILILLLHINLAVYAWDGMPTPKLHVEGRYLKDPHGNIVNLHGVAVTPSPWFNGGAFGIWDRWNNYDVEACLNYNKSVLDLLTDTSEGWYLNYIRLHIDPYWTNNLGVSGISENDISEFNYERFKTAIDEVIVPMIEYAETKGLYVILRPPGVCPEEISIGGEYHEYLLKVWGYISQHESLRNTEHLMFELANEPIKILGTNGDMGSNTQPHFDALKDFFQEIVDTIRVNGAENILWIPGTGYQSQYKGYAVNPVEGDNIGYAVHIYPGYWGGVRNYESFQSAWDENVKPVADFAPIAVTEIDWSPDDDGDGENMGTWGTGTTGVAQGEGFGANFNYITNASGNVSWNLLAPDNLIHYAEPENWTFAYESNEEACAVPCYNWFKEYAEENYPRANFEYLSTSDNGDGTYSNPLIYGDFPDPDVIRVGDVYYMVTTTMHIFPGATLLKSEDLVNWEYCSNPLQKIASTDCYNLNECDRYSHGQWASSLKYNDGTFYLLFTTLDEGSFLLTTEDPEGTWEMQALNNSYYDPGLFFDDDGKIYVVYGINTLKISELDSNFELVDGTTQEVYTYTVKEGLEGSHLYKIGDYYYIYATYGGWPAYQTVLRSTNIYGSYEEKLVLDDNNIHQGALIETQTGEWWTILFQDNGALGRMPNLQPVNWQDNWPVIGSDGVAVTTYVKPDVGKEHTQKYLPTNDNFRNYELGMQWGWNHNPDNSKWSLVQNPDYLRLETVGVVENLSEAQNTLTQRILGYPNNGSESYGTIKLNIENMQEGDVAGLAVFQDPYAYIGIKVIDGKKTCIQMNDDVLTIGDVIDNSEIYLRAIVNTELSKASFFYSIDNEVFINLGSELDMQFDLSVFTGNKFCIFNFATIETGGYVDVDWFSTEESFTEDTFYDDSFTGYTEEYLTLTDLLIDDEDIELLTGSVSAMTVTAVYADGHSKDVTLGATYDNSNAEVIRVANGNIVALADGEATITITYKGEIGEAISKVLNVSSSTFPLTEVLFNPSIYATGSFYEGTQTLVTGQYGFGGWEYDTGIDFSGYKYLVVELADVNTCSASFRLFDSSNYWGGSAQYDFGSEKQIVVRLSSMYNSDTSELLDPSHIYIVGFWSMGNCDISIQNIFLTNSVEYDTAIEEDILYYDGNEIVDVYNIMGVLVRSGVKRKNATQGLSSGLYIIGNKKVYVSGL